VSQPTGAKQPKRLLKAVQCLKRSSFFYRACVFVAQFICFTAAGVGAFLLRFDFMIPGDHMQHLDAALAIWLIGKSLTFTVLGLDRGWWRFVSLSDVLRITLGNMLASVVCAVAILIIAPPGFPRSLYFLDLIISLLLTSGVRIAVRIVFETARQSRNSGSSKRILIYGAGAAGQILAREIRSNLALRYTVCGYVDDDPDKQGIPLQGISVLGCSGDLEQLASRFDIQEVLIAVPSASGPQMASMMQACHAARLSCKTVPGMTEVIEQRGLAAQVREVNVEDLLGRTPLQLDQERIRAQHEGKTVLVTGAGGSIGSELCRRIAPFGPRAIIGFDVGEYGLFQLELDMRKLFPQITFCPSIGSIQNPLRLSEVFQRYSPSLVYHAAAYKHVPLMEAHIFEAVENNVLGTWNLVLAAKRYRVSDFVMVSSDKAVRPTNIMGLTKRLAELLVHSQEDTETKFVSVRFGNVLGSSGSVIPIFKRQISHGGPLTITHPNMRRYFMTIPEAVQLVLQASTMGAGGEIFILEMGEPVKIMDLAHNMILLSGLRPHEDIKIEVTGVRPGEKLFEELSTADETTRPTYHEQIRILSPEGLPTQDELRSHVEALQRLCAARDSRALLLRLKEAVPEYNPSSDVLRQILSVEDMSVAASAL
jgi:FlaA1/EpsC-like NDP-sugar epimerase